VDERIKREMMSYYAERAAEYDDIYVGKGPASLDSALYGKDVSRVAELAGSFGTGHLIDIACGTGFWLPHYAQNCDRFTFVDQSERMLEQCRQRVQSLGLASKATFIRGDFLELRLDAAQYDCAFVGFFLSHLTEKEEGTFFTKLQHILKPGRRLMLVDSAWNEGRQKVRAKAGVQERLLTDGRAFRIFKRYFEESDIRRTLKRQGFVVRSSYSGRAFIAVVAQGAG